MSELISGKEALIAFLDGKDVEFKDVTNTWHKAHGGLTLDSVSRYQFRIKPKTITINNIEVPAPFEPKEGDECWHIWTQSDKGYGWCYEEDKNNLQFGAWRTEDEIKQVVAALRKIFVINNQ
jgi:hypothetical protein